MQVKNIKSQEGGEAVVLKMQVRKDEIIHGMFPVITIGKELFKMDMFVKEEDSEVFTTSTCLDIGETDDV